MRELLGRPCLPAPTGGFVRLSVVSRVCASKLNLDFVAKCNEYRVTRPRFFGRPDWPLRLIDEVVISENAK